MSDEKFLIKPDTSCKPARRFFVYDREAMTDYVAEIFIPEKKRDATLRFNHKNLYNVMARKTTQVTEVSMETSYTFVTPKVSEDIVDYLNELSYAARLFIEKHKSKQRRYFYKVLFYIPLSDDLQVKKAPGELYTPVPETATSTQYNVSVENGCLIASLMFEDNCITLGHIRALHHFSASVTYLLTGEGLPALCRRIDETEDLLDTKPLQPGCYIDKESLVIFKIDEERGV